MDKKWCAKYTALHLDFIFSADASGNPEVFDATSLQHKNYLYNLQCKLFTLKNDLAKKKMSDYKSNSLSKNLNIISSMLEHEAHISIIIHIETAYEGVLSELHIFLLY